MEKNKKNLRTFYEVINDDINKCVSREMFYECVKKYPISDMYYRKENSENHGTYFVRSWIDRQYFYMNIARLDHHHTKADKNL